MPYVEKIGYILISAFAGAGGISFSSLIGYSGVQSVFFGLVISSGSGLLFAYLDDLQAIDNYLEEVQA